MGYGQPPRRMLAYARDVAPDNSVLICPEGPSAFYRRPHSDEGASKHGIGYGWIADARRADAELRNTSLLARARAMAEERTSLAEGRFAIMGFSQGVGVAPRYAIEHPSHIGAIVGLAGGVPSAWRDRLSALAAIPVLWVTGAQDASYPPAYEDKLVAPHARGWRSRSNTRPRHRP